MESNQQKRPGRFNNTLKASQNCSSVQSFASITLSLSFCMLQRLQPLRYVTSHSLHLVDSTLACTMQLNGRRHLSRTRTVWKSSGTALVNYSRRWAWCILDSCDQFRRPYRVLFQPLGNENLAGNTSKIAVMIGRVPWQRISKKSKRRLLRWKKVTLRSLWFD